MKRSPLMQFVVLCVGLILLSAIVPVNPSSVLSRVDRSTLVADGVPLPPPEPAPKHIAGMLPDGVPLPAPEPPPKNIKNLIDGVPLPASEPPPKHITGTLIDGVPLPPPEPAPKQIEMRRS